MKIDLKGAPKGAPFSYFLAGNCFEEENILMMILLFLKKGESEVRNSTQLMTRTAFLLALAAICPLLGLPQFITGVAVNVVLYISTFLVGPIGGIIIGCLIPWVAALRGILPPPLVIAAPFIMLGNIALVLVFHYFRYRIPLVGIIGAALVKFAIIILGARVIIPQFIHVAPGVAAKVAAILGIAQIFTALAAGFLALIDRKSVV